MKKNVFLGIIIIFSLLFMNHILSNGWLTQLGDILQTNYNLSWYQINDLYFLAAFLIYLLMFVIFNMASKNQKKVILLIVPITTMGSILLLRIYFVGLFRYLYWTFRSFGSNRYDIFLYCTGLITLLVSFKIVIKSNKLYAFLCIIVLNTVLLYFAYLAYSEILASQTV